MSDVIEMPTPINFSDNAVKKVKELKAICHEHGLSQTGNKNALIDRIIEEGVINQLENSSNSVELTENLTQ